MGGEGRARPHGRAPGPPPARGPPPPAPPSRAPCPPAPPAPRRPRRTTAGTARGGRRRDRRAEAPPLPPRSELRPQLRRAQGLPPELAVRRHEVADDTEHDLRLVAERAENLVPLEQGFSAWPGVHGEVSLGVAPFAEEGVRLLDRVGHDAGSSGTDPSRVG